jgi:hypothetical protein
MDKKTFNELLESVLEAKAIMRGEKNGGCHPARSGIAARRQESCSPSRETFALAGGNPESLMRK